MTPRYASNIESKISACSGFVASPIGGGTRSITAASSASTPAPDFALMCRMSSGSQSSSAASSFVRCSGSAAGRSILLSAGTMTRPGVARQVVVRQGLGFQALGGIDQQHGALTGGQRTRDLVGEVHVAGRVDQVEFVALVRQAHRLRLDRDAALALQVHLVQVLGAHVTALDRVRDLEQAVGQRRFAVVDVRHDAEVADVGSVGGGERGHGTTMVRARAPAAGSGLRAAGRLAGRYGEHQVTDQTEQAERQGRTSGTRPCAPR